MSQHDSVCPFISECFDALNVYSLGKQPIILFISMVTEFEMMQ
jgi:hypothetical protein